MVARLSLVAGLLPLVLAATPATGQTPTSDRLTLDLYLEWEGVSDPQVSPDGRQIVYTRRWVDKVNDRWSSSLWIMQVDGSRNRFLTEGSGARWSPDGSRIAFVHDGEPKGTQIFVRWMDAEGATTQITRVEDRPADLAWSPDGQTIAFLMNVAERPSLTVKLPPRPDGAKWTADPKVVTRLWYRRDRLGYIDGGYRHVFLVPAGGGTPGSSRAVTGTTARRCGPPTVARSCSPGSARTRRSTRGANPKSTPST